MTDKTPEERAQWAAYMREYRRRRKEDPNRVRHPTDGPTPRQLEILRLYADPELGGTHKRVAAVLGISPSAVHRALGRLTSKLGVRTPAQAIYKLWVRSEQHGTSEEVPRPQSLVPRS